MARFAEIVEALKPKSKSGLDTFGTDTCSICSVKFDPSDAKVWTRETGKAHFTCYLKAKGKLKDAEKFERLMAK